MLSDVRLQELYQLACQYVRKALNQNFVPPRFSLAPSNVKWTEFFRAIQQREKVRYPERLKGPTELPAITIRGLGKTEIVGNSDLLPRYPRYLVLVTLVHELLHCLRSNWTESEIEIKAKEIVEKFEPVQQEKEIDLAKMALSLSDLPQGFREWEVKITDNQTAAKGTKDPLGTLKKYQEWGRKIGYSVIFGREYSPGTKGPLQIKNSLGLFEVAKGAEAAFQNFVKEFAAIPDTEEIPMPEKIGKKCIAFQGLRKERVEFITFIISFVYQNIWTILILTGLKESFNFDQALKIAKTAERKIKVSKLNQTQSNLRPK